MSSGEFKIWWGHPLWKTISRPSGQPSKSIFTAADEIWTSSTVQGRGWMKIPEHTCIPRPIVQPGLPQACKKGREKIRTRMTSFIFQMVRKEWLGNWIEPQKKYLIIFTVYSMFSQLQSSQSFSFFIQFPVFSQLLFYIEKTVVKFFDVPVVYWCLKTLIVSKKSRKPCFLFLLLHEFHESCHFVNSISWKQRV